MWYILEPVMELAEPIELLTSVRDSGGLVCAVAKTTDGKGASVVGMEKLNPDLLLKV